MEICAKENVVLNSEQDEIFQNCLKCGNEWLYTYWDQELECYVYLTKKEEKCCSNCRKITLMNN